MGDKTNFAQSLMHMIKGNLGTGILAMPMIFAHTGIIIGSIGLPMICIIATYCVHLLVRSSQHLEHKMKWANLEYAELAKGSFRMGPSWMKPWSGVMCRLVDAVLIISQMGICGVYARFIVGNVNIILGAFKVDSYSEVLLFGILFVLILPICLIRTLKRLSYASAIANVLQALGIAIIVQYLIKELLGNDLQERDLVRPFRDAAQGFGAAMFAFEGISVVLPIYTRMKRQEQMGGCLGVINISYAILLLLYFIIGSLGYLRFGSKAEGSISLNLPSNDLLFDSVRIMFTIAVFLSYPLQFYVPNEIIWNWARDKFSTDDEKSPTKPNSNYEYLCRSILVIVTFVLAISVKKLGLMMELVGSISGTSLSITLPALIHIAAFWEETSGVSKKFMLTVDSLLIVFGLIGTISGSYFSLIAIIESM